MTRMARSSNALSRGHDGMASRRGSLQDRKRVASHADQVGRLEGYKHVQATTPGMASASQRRVSKCCRSSPCYPVTWVGSLRITVGSIFRPCREIRALLHARLFCIPDLRSERVECKVHAHKQRHGYLIPQARGRSTPLVSRYNVTLVRVGHCQW